MKGKIKVTFGQILTVIIMLCAGLICGKYGSDILFEYLEESRVLYTSESSLYLAMLLPVLFSFYAGYLLAIPLHEAGHLVFGLLSGYEFSSFRVGSIILVKTGDGLKLCRFTLAGTGGQCIMIPPKMTDGKYPYKLYNFGGSILNLSVGAICLCISSCAKASFFTLFLFIFAVMSIAIGLCNGIPLKLGTINNDGYNALNMDKNPAAMKALWYHLSLYRYFCDGLYMKDIPEELIYEPTDEELNDPLVAGYSTALFARYMDRGDEEKAFDYAKHILSVSKGILPIHRLSLEGELLYRELCGERDSAVVEKYMTPLMKKMMKAYKSTPTMARFAYAYEKFCGNENKSEKILKSFKKALASYPYIGEAEFEKRLMERAM